MERVGGKESILEKISIAIDVALRKSRGAAIVNVGNLNQERITGCFPSDFVRVSTATILGEETPTVPREAKGIVVTSCQKDLPKDAEDRIQSFVRGTVANRSPSGRADEFPVVVFSKTLPNERVFHNASLPWFNGPFEGDDSVFSLEEKPGGKLDMKRYTLKTEIKEKRRVDQWDIKEEIEF